MGSVSNVVLNLMALVSSCVKVTDSLVHWFVDVFVHGGQILQSCICEWVGSCSNESCNVWMSFCF